MDRSDTPIIDKLLIAPIRLGVMARLVQAGGAAPLVDIRAACGSPSHALMFSHHRQLERAGFILLEKFFDGRVARTTVVITERGRTAYERHRKALAATINMEAAAS